MSMRPRLPPVMPYSLSGGEPGCRRHAGATLVPRQNRYLRSPSLVSALRMVSGPTS